MQLRKRTLRILDFLIAGPAFLAALFLYPIRRSGLGWLPLTRKALRRAKTLPIIDHYYEPLINPRHLSAALSEERSLPGIQWNDEEQLRFLRQLTSYASERHAPDSNGQFEFADADYWYCLIRATKPRRIIEIGSGFSTLIARAAINMNGSSCEHICIEPYENPWLEKCGAKIVRERVETVDRNLFSQLGQNDILFIDSSHVIRPQGDVVTEVLEILPTLNSGVVVQFHDIFSPRDYPWEWVAERLRLWSEQYLVEAFLTNNTEWSILGALNYLKHKYPDELSRISPLSNPNHEPGSLYIVRH